MRLLAEINRESLLVFLEMADYISHGVEFKLSSEGISFSQEESTQLAALSASLFSDMFLSYSLDEESSVCLHLPPLIEALTSVDDVVMGISLDKYGITLASEHLEHTQDLCETVFPPFTPVSDFKVDVPLLSSYLIHLLSRFSFPVTISCVNRFLTFTFSLRQYTTTITSSLLARNPARLSSTFNPTVLCGFLALLPPDANITLFLNDNAPLLIECVIKDIAFRYYLAPLDPKKK